MGVSIWQLLIVLVILLLIFGPNRIEGIGKSLGKSIKGFKKGLEEGEAEARHEKKDDPENKA